MAISSSFYNQLDELKRLKSIDGTLNPANIPSKKALTLDAKDDDTNRESPVGTLGRQSPAAPPLDLNLSPGKSDELMLMLVVQFLRNGSSCYSLVSTKHDLFEVVVKGDMSSFSALLKSQNCNPLLYAKPYDYQVTTACNPWILMSCGDIDTCGEIDDTGLDFLWNPFTNEIKTLPPFTSEPPLPSRLESDISFYGLGIDPSSGDYKIVRAREFSYTDDDPDYEMKVQAELLSLETGLWKEIPYPYPPQMAVYPVSVHINGFCYWTAMLYGELSICSFDFAKQKFSPKLIPMPESDRIVDMYTVSLAEFSGSLAVVAYDDKMRRLAEGEPVNRETSDVEVWVWNNGSWSKEHSCTIPADVYLVSGLFTKNKLLLADSKGKLLLYDCVTNELVDLCSSDDIKGLEMFPLFGPAFAAPGDIVSSSSNLSLPGPSSGDFISSSSNSSHPGPSSASSGNIRPSRVSTLDLSLWLDEMNELMLMVQHLRNGARYYSIYYTKYSVFKPVLKDNLSSLSSLLGAQKCALELYEKPDYHVLTGCKAWMLLSSCGKSPEMDDAVFLWNPINDEIKTLPTFCSQPPTPSPIASRIQLYGMGVDPASGCIKVVRTRAFEFGDGSVRKVQAELLSLETGMWKEIPYSHDSLMPTYQQPCRHINGICYWVAEDVASGRLALLSFNFANEKFSRDLIPMPDSNKIKNVCTVALGDLNGSLAVIAFGEKLNGSGIGAVEKNKAFCVEFWVWKDGSWSNGGTHAIPADVDAVVGLVGVREVLLMDSKGGLLLYDLRTGMMFILEIRDANEAVELFPLF